MTLEASEEITISGSIRGTIDPFSISFESRLRDLTPRFRVGAGLIFQFAEIGVSGEFGSRRSLSAVVRQSYSSGVFYSDVARFTYEPRRFPGFSARATVSSRIPLGPVVLRPLYAGAQLREGRFNIVIEEESTLRGTYFAPGWLAGAGVDVALSCDFAARSFAEFAGQDVSVPGVGARDSRVFLSFGAGLMFAPSTQCRRERRIERTPAHVEPAR
jgi:hypothetical protein